MQLLKVIIFIKTPLFANSKTPEDKNLCIGIKYSEDAAVYLIDTAKEKKETYKKEYSNHLKSIETKEERPYNKKETAKEAKGYWDNYLKNEYLTESVIYEKDSHGFNDSYNLCLIGNYNKRIEYYRKNKF